MSRFKRITSAIVAASVLSSSMWTSAQAATISTQAAAQEQSISAEAANQARVSIVQTLQREDLRQALLNKGVNPEDVQARVHSLNDEEVLALSDQLERAPAGASDVLGTLVFIFVLLLVTDILGLTKVFPFTRSIRR